MAKNVKMTRNGNIVQTFSVPAGTVGGEVLAIGTDGLMVLTMTDAYASIDPTSATTYPQGIDAANEVSAEILGVNVAVELTVGDGAVAVGDAVYLVAGSPDTYSNADGSGANTLIGWALTATSAAGDVATVGLKGSA